MTSKPFTDARKHLSELIDQVARTHERITITRHGHAVAVLMAPDDLAALEETIEVISRPEVMHQLAESKRAIEADEREILVSGDECYDTQRHSRGVLHADGEEGDVVVGGCAAEEFVAQAVQRDSGQYGGSVDDVVIGMSTAAFGEPVGVEQ